jgi:hypothetical protein
LVGANEFYPRQRNGAADNPEIGGDGHPYTVEIRTKPKESPKEVAEEIQRILKTHFHEVPAEVCWRAGSYFKGKTLGGHIHFGGIALEDTLVEALDGVLAQVLTLLEDPQEAMQRRATQYGALGDIRVKGWGFEYRTLASFIVSPEIATGVYTLAKAVVVEELAADSMSLRKLRGKRLKILTDINRNQYIKADRGYFYDKLPEIWEIISRYGYFFTDEGRPLWKNVALLRHIAMNYPSWHTDRDLLHRWKVRKKTPAAYAKHFKDKKEKLPKEGVLHGDEALEILARNRRQG